MNPLFLSGTLLLAGVPAVPVAALPGMGWVFWSVLIVLVVVILALAALLLWQHRRARKDAAAGAPEPAQAAHATHAELASAFKAALQAQRSMVSGRSDFRYKLPWFALLGSAGSGKSALMTDSTLAHAVEQRTGAAAADPVSWSFTSTAVVMEVGGWAMEDTQAAARTWKDLLHHLVNTRPERGLDGLILTVAAGDLWGPKALLPAQLTARGALLQGRLRQLAKTLGFQLPVSVLLTRCDELEGFQAFAGELDSRELDQIFGWSNPYQSNLEFQGEWVDEAVHTMRLAVERTQNRIFASQEPGPARGSMYLLPNSLHGTLGPLRVMLSRALRGGGDIPAPLLRGIYCMGSVTATALALAAEPEWVPVGMPQGAGLESYGMLSHAPQYDEALPELAPSPVTTAAGGGPQIGFVHDLFLEKIFAERNLGRPLEQFFRLRDRTRLYLQLAAVSIALLLLIGTGLAYRRMAADSRALQGVLGHIYAAETNARESYTADPSQVDTHPGARELVAVIATFRSGKFHSVFLPASLFSAVPEQTSRVVENAFGQLVLARFYDGLQARAGWLADSSHAPLAASQLPPEPAAATPVTDVRQTPDYLQMQAFLGQVAALDGAMTLYNQMCRPHSNAPLSTIVRLDGFLHNRTETVPEDNDGKPFFQKALDEAHYPCFTEYPERAGISGHAEALISNLDAAWIAHNPARRASETLQGELSALSTAPSADPATLTRIGDDVRRTELVYAAPSLHWVGVSPLAVPSDLAAVTTGIASTSAFFTPGLAGRASVLAEMNLSQLLSSLSSAETPATGLLNDFSTGQLTLSPGTQELATALDALSKSSFVSAAAAPSFALETTHPAAISWDKAGLDAAAAVPAAYGKFVSESLGKTPAPVRLLVGRLAAAAAAGTISQGILQAEHTSIGTDAAADARSFADAEPSLTALLGALAQYKLSAPMQALRFVADRQAAGVLEELEGSLAQKQPYGVPSSTFAHWDEGLPSGRLLDAGTPDALAAYLAAQQEQVAALTAAATPAVQFLESNRAALTPSMVRSLTLWQGFNSAVEAFAGKKPGNSLQLLQDLISTGMNKVVPANGCTAARLPLAGQRDYFAQVAIQLQRNLVLRCRELLNRDFDSAYTRLTSAFNQSLAERFPFGPLSSLPLAEADPALIGRFYGLYDASADLLTSSRLNSAPQAAQDFLRQLAGGRPWIAPLLAPEGAGDLTFSVNPTLRVNRGQEVNGDQVITWALRIGDTTFHNGDQPTKLLWKLGDPVVLSLRWARNSPWLPAQAYPASQIAGEMRSDGETVTWKFADTWALLRCLRAFEQPDPERKSLKAAGEESFLLGLTVPLVQAPTGVVHAQPAAPALARVYIRLMVSAPGQKEALPPPVFPAVAPALESPTQALSGGLQ